MYLETIILMAVTILVVKAVRIGEMLFSKIYFPFLISREIILSFVSTLFTPHKAEDSSYEM